MCIDFSPGDSAYGTTVVRTDVSARGSAPVRAHVSAHARAAARADVSAQATAPVLARVSARADFCVKPRLFLKVTPNRDIKRTVRVWCVFAVRFGVLWC